MSKKENEGSWDLKDGKHCVALHHEFLRCEEAFYEFRKLKSEIPLYGFSRYLSYRIYNVYARYILHLYEFLIGALTREIELKILSSKNGNLKKNFYGDGVSGKQRAETIESLINDMAHRATCSITGQDNINIPTDFATNFRIFRNKIIGHVSFERAEMDITDFYNKYDAYLTAIFLHSKSHWGIERQNSFPDLQQITKFFINLEKDTAKSGSLP